MIIFGMAFWIFLILMIQILLDFLQSVFYSWIASFIIVLANYEEFSILGGVS